MAEQAMRSSDGPRPGDESLVATRVFLRPIANPFALGFLGLAGDSVTVAGYEIGWIAPSDLRHVGLIVLVFAPLLQVVACVFGFLSRDPVAATGMGTLAATWSCIGLVLLTSAPGGTSRALGTLLFLAAVAVLPTLRRGSGRTALDGVLADQVEEVATEAAVRRQL